MQALRVRAGGQTAAEELILASPLWKIRSNHLPEPESAQVHRTFACTQESLKHGRSALL